MVGARSFDVGECSMGLDPSPALPEAGEPSWLWIILGWTAVVANAFLLGQFWASVLQRFFGTSAVEFGLRVRSSALFNWLLLGLDFAIGLFFVALLLVAAGLLFDGFHESWGAPEFLARFGEAHVVGTSIPVAAAGAIVIVGCVGARFVLLAWRLSNDQQPQPHHQQQQQQQRRARFASDTPVLDYVLCFSAGMTLLWAFPWPTVPLSRGETTDAKLLLFEVTLLALLLWAFLLYVTVQLRNRLYRQIASIGTS